jgi:hypothetical protein
MISSDIDLTVLHPGLTAADAARVVDTLGAPMRIAALDQEPRAAALATLMPLLAVEHQQLLLDAAAAVDARRPGARALAAVILDLDPSLRQQARDLAEALPGRLGEWLTGSDTAPLHQEVIQALAFTGMPAGSDAERAAYLRAWQRPPQTREERFLAVAYGAEAFLRWGFGQDTYANEHAHLVLEYLVEESRLDARRALWRAENPRGAALAAEITARLRRIEQTVEELQPLETDAAIARGVAIADPKDRADVFRGLAARVSTFRRKAICEAAIGAMHAIADPLTRCLTACHILPLLPTGPDREAVVRSTLADLRAMGPEAQPYAATSVARALNDDERAQMRALADSLPEHDSAGAGKVAVLAALIPYARGQERRQIRDAARRIARTLPATAQGANGKSLRAEALEYLEQARELTSIHSPGGRKQRRDGHTEVD